MGFVLKRSDVVLMHGLEPWIWQTYGAIEVAWGGGPRDEGQVDEWKERIQKARQMRIRYSCSNAWMLSARAEVLAEDPGLRQAVCLDFNYNRIIPRWIDNVYKDIPSYWGCTNNPRFREHLRNQVILAMQAGADGLHLDDHVGSAHTLDHAGCFCEYCMKGFRKYLKNKYKPEELKKKGIDDIENFNYCQILRRAFGTPKTFLEAYQQRASCLERVHQAKFPEIPLIEEFLTYQLKTAADLVKELGDIAKKLRGKPIPISANSFNLYPHQLVDSPYLDYFVAEINHQARNGKIPASLIFVYKFADALNKPLALTAEIGDWAYINEKDLTGLVKLWIALSYIFGHHFMPPAPRQYCFSKEKGGHWYNGLKHIKEFAPVYQFVRQNADLFDNYVPVGQIGVLYSNLAFRRGYQAVYDVCRNLLNANVPFGLAIAGDEWLPYKLTEEELSRFEMVVVPESAMLEGEQKHLIEKWTVKDQVIFWKNEKDLKKVLHRVKSLVSLESASNVWILPRKIPNQPDTPLICHLLNRSYDVSTDKMKKQSGVLIGLDNELFGNRKLREATFIAPQCKPEQLRFKAQPDGVYITIPELDIWGILKLVC